MSFQGDINFFPRCIILMGLPGSGKSTLANEIILNNNNQFQVINQDTLGNRIACENAMKSALLENKRIIVDRCNFDEKQRSHWISLVKANCNKDDNKICLIEINMPIEDCLLRCKYRENHPTVNRSNYEMVLNDMSRNYGPNPKLGEGFNCIINLNKTDLEGTINQITQTIVKTERSQSIINWLRNWLNTFTPVIPMVPSPILVQSTNPIISKLDYIRKPSVCKNFNSPTGCLYGKNCRFSHSIEVAGTIKKPCSKFNSSLGCVFGTNCRFSHDPIIKENQNKSVFQSLQVSESLNQEKVISSPKVKKVKPSKEVKTISQNRNMFSNLDDDSNDDDDDDSV